MCKWRNYRKLDSQTVTVLNDGSNTNSGGVNLVEETNRGDKKLTWNGRFGGTTSSESSNKINCTKTNARIFSSKQMVLYFYSKIMPENTNLMKRLYDFF